MCDSRTPKKFSVRLDPGETQQGLTSIFCVFDLKSQFCIRHSRRSRVVPGHQRTSLSDLIPVSYHLFSETHDHHFVPARPTNRATRFGPPFSVFSASGLNFCGEHSKGLFVFLGHQRTSLSDFVLVRYDCRSESRFSDFSSHCRFGPSRPYFCFVRVSDLGIGGRLRRGVKSKMRGTKVRP